MPLPAWMAGFSPLDDIKVKPDQLVASAAALLEAADRHRRRQEWQQTDALSSLATAQIALATYLKARLRHH